MSKPLTGEEYMKLLEGPLHKYEKKTLWSQDPGAFAQGGYVGPQMVQTFPSSAPCMAAMEQPGMWLVENTKRKLIYCNHPSGHPGNHRFTMEWSDGRQPSAPENHAYKSSQAAEYWGNTWKEPGDAYLAAKYGAFLDEPKTPLVDPKDIKIAFSIDTVKEQEK